MNGGQMTHSTRNLRQTAADLRTLARNLSGYLGAPVTSQDIDWERVADAIQRRMDELHLTQAAMHELADVSPVTLRKFLRPAWARSEPPRRVSVIGVSTALGWGPDGLFRIGQGEDPEVISAEMAAAGDDTDLGKLLLRIAEQLGAVVEELSTHSEHIAAVDEKLDDVVTRLDRLERGRAAGNDG